MADECWVTLVELQNIDVPSRVPVEEAHGKVNLGWPTIGYSIDVTKKSKEEGICKLRTAGTLVLVSNQSHRLNNNWKDLQNLLAMTTRLRSMACIMLRRYVELGFELNREVALFE